MITRNNLYLLVDGTQADPKDCSKGGDGVLRHKSGMAVAMRETGEPQTIGVDALLHGNVQAAAAGVAAAENETAITVEPVSAGRTPIAPVADDKPAAPRGETKAD